MCRVVVKVLVLVGSVGGAIRKLRFCAGKMSVIAFSWYSGRGAFRNGPSACSLERILREAFAREAAGGPKARPSQVDDLRRSGGLRLELGDGGLHELVRDATPDQIVADHGVSGLSLRKRLSPAAREARVIDSARPHQARQRLAPGERCDLVPRKPVGKLFLGQIAPRERAGGLRHRLMPHELTAYSPRPGAIELDTDRQACRQDCLGRQGPPGLLFQYDLDAPARAREQGANPWRRPLRGQLPPP